MFILLMLITAVPAYILGSLNGAIIASKTFFRKDIRDYGSGNPGLTNFYRTFGKVGVLLVILIDVLKTVTPVLFGGWLFAEFADMYITEVWGIWPFNIFFNEAFFGQALAGFFVMMGHCFPLFYKFKGGKGVTAIGAIVIVIDWRLALISWGVFVLIVLLTRFVSLGAMLGSVAFPTSMLIMNLTGVEEFGLAELNIIIMCVLLVIVRHVPNILRLVKGEESKFSFSRKKERKHEEEHENEHVEEDG